MGLFPITWTDPAPGSLRNVKGGWEGAARKGLASDLGAQALLVPEPGRGEWAHIVGWQPWQGRAVPTTDGLGWTWRRRAMAAGAGWTLGVAGCLENVSRPWEGWALGLGEVRRWAV